MVIQTRKMSSMKIRILSGYVLGILLLLPITAEPVMALKPNYGLQQWQAGGRTSVRIYDLKTRRTIWVRSYTSIDGTYPDNGKFFWSQNHRAVAFGAGRAPTQNNKSNNSRKRLLVVWRAGRRVQTVFYQPGLGTDYTEDMTWSPQGKYLILRGGGSGMGDADLGRMICLDINTQHTYPLGDAVGKPIWISPRTIKFWQADFRKQDQQGIVRASQPSYWTVPYIK
jgi:hypothetical protein